MQRFFTKSLGEIILEPRLIVFKGGFTLFGFNCRYSVLLGLADNFFGVIHTNTSLIRGFNS